MRCNGVSAKFEVHDHCRVRSVELDACAWVGVMQNMSIQHSLLVPACFRGSSLTRRVRNTVFLTGMSNSCIHAKQMGSHHCDWNSPFFQGICHELFHEFANTHKHAWSTKTSPTSRKTSWHSYKVSLLPANNPARRSNVGFKRDSPYLAYLGNDSGYLASPNVCYTIHGRAKAMHVGIMYNYIIINHHQF